MAYIICKTNKLVELSCTCILVLWAHEYQLRKKFWNTMLKSSCHKRFSLHTRITDHSKVLISYIFPEIKRRAQTINLVAFSPKPNSTPKPMQITYQTLFNHVPKSPLSYNSASTPVIYTQVLQLKCISKMH